MLIGKVCVHVWTFDIYILEDNYIIMQIWKWNWKCVL